MTNDVTDIADEIYEELGSPSDISNPLISFWLQRNIGRLNSLIQTSYTIESSVSSIEISPTLGEDEKAIYKTLYYIYYYNRLIQNNLGAAAFDAILEVGSDRRTVKMVNKNEVAKTYLALKKANQDELKELINGYALNRSTPLAVAGTDTTAACGYYTGTTRRDY